MGGTVVGCNGSDEVLGGLLSPDYSRSNKRVFDSDPDGLSYSAISHRHDGNSVSQSNGSRSAKVKKYPMAELPRARSIIGTDG